MPESNAILSPSIANMCIVPARRKGSPMSPVNAVRQPRVIAHKSLKGSSSLGNPSASVPLDQVKNRSVSGGFGKTGGSSCQSLVDSVLSW